MGVLLFLSAIVAPIDHPRTYLLSVERIPLHAGDRIEGFSFLTWGVEFKAVCHLPVGWTVKAGGSLTPEGVLEGEGSLGSTWFMQGSPHELTRLALVVLYDPVQKVDSGIVPATFKGRATLWNNDRERKVALTYRNIRLVPARHCPAA
jgi:hypothetical protein